MITVDRRKLVRELVAALREDGELRRELVAALDLGGDGAERFVSPATYARTHALGVSTVRAAIRDGRLAAVRIGRAVRIATDATIASRSTDTALARAEHRLGLVTGGRR